MSTRTFSIGVILATTVAASVFAGTTGQLGGIVYDEGGSPLQGVTVSASSPSQIGAVQLATTGADGGFRFPRFAPGYYTVLFELVGHGPQQFEEVQVRLDRVTGLHVVLQRTSFAAEIEVVETTPVVDPVQTSTGQTFTSGYITTTSAVFFSLVKQTAGASQDFRRVLGSTPQDGGYQLDGMDSTNWYQRYPNPASYNIIFDAIQEVAVHTAGYEAEFGQATGAIVNVSTKSGGNTFHCTLDARYSGSSLETGGDYYDPDLQDSKFARISATLGGPIIKDRLWFFTSFGRLEMKNTGFGAPVTREMALDSFLAKLTWQASDSWSVVGKYINTPAIDDYSPSSQFTAPEATSTWEDKPSIASLQAVGVLSPSVLWEIRLGRNEWNETGLPSDGDLFTIGHYNTTAGTYYQNYPQQYYSEKTQNQASTDISWFVNAAGSHEFKTGLSVGNPQFSENSCYNGGGQRCSPGVEGFYFRDGLDDVGVPTPSQMWVSKAEGAMDFGADYLASFAQDTWQVRPNLNLNLGVRWDRVTWGNETGQIADLSKLQPRVGIAWDVANNGKTMVRASWGRFMHPGTALFTKWTNTDRYPTEYWYSCSANGVPDAELCATVAGAYGLGYRSDPENWDPAGWFLYPGNVVSTKPGQAIDGFRPGVSDQWLLGFERELFRRTSVEVTYVNKESADDIYSTCNGNYPEPSVDAACDYWLFANLPGKTFDYQGLMMRFESRALDNLHLLASWVISESKGPSDYNSGSTNDYDYYPYHYVNRYGYLADHSLHRLKLNGYWLLPYDFSLTFNGWWQSESRWTPFDRTVPGMPYDAMFVEPRGSGKGGALFNLDLQISKGFRVGPTRLVALATIYNATNSQNANEICGSVTGCGQYGFGEAIHWQQPRYFELGFRVEF